MNKLTIALIYINEVTFVDDNDISYLSFVDISHPSSIESSSTPDEALAAQGKIRFATCEQSVTIPVSFLVHLLKADYNESKESTSCTDAINNWLLLELLNAVRGHTLL